MEDNAQITIKKHIRFPNFDLYLRSDGIAVLTSKDNAWITIREAKLFVQAMKEITGGIPHPLLFVPGKYASIDKEARTYMASEEATSCILARATIPSSLAHRIIGELHQRIDNPAKPVKLFDRISDAIDWLKEQQRLHQ